MQTSNRLSYTCLVHIFWKNIDIIDHFSHVKKTSLQKGYSTVDQILNPWNIRDIEERFLVPNHEALNMNC